MPFITETGNRYKVPERVPDPAKEPMTHGSPPHAPMEHSKYLSKCTLLMPGAVHSSELNSTPPQASLNLQMLLGPRRKTHSGPDSGEMITPAPSPIAGELRTRAGLEGNSDHLACCQTSCLTHSTLYIQGRSIGKARHTRRGLLPSTGLLVH